MRVSGFLPCGDVELYGWSRRRIVLHLVVRKRINQARIRRN
jgi:hypothetical protein